MIGTTGAQGLRVAAPHLKLTNNKNLSRSEWFRCEPEFRLATWPRNHGKIAAKISRRGDAFGSQVRCGPRKHGGVAAFSAVFFSMNLSRPLSISRGNGNEQ